MKLTPEEKIIQEEKMQRRKETRLLNAQAKKQKTKPAKVQPSESDLVHKYANQVINGKIARGHVDERFGYTKKDGTVSKELWLDADFFFTVVFESEAQKNRFLEFFQAMYKFQLEDFEDNQIQIVNGLKLAKAMGWELKRETSR